MSEKDEKTDHVEPEVEVEVEVEKVYDGKEQMDTADKYDVKNLSNDDLGKDSNDHPMITLPATLHERFLHIKQIVKNAIASHHTFMVCGRAKVIREYLLKKGWIEKLYRRNNTADLHQKSLVQLQTQHQHISVDSNPVILLSGIGDLKDECSQRLLMSKMLANHTVDFLWNSGSDWPGWPNQENEAMIFNRYSRAGFTSKIGLCSSVRQMQWYYEPGIANTLFPRCYNICQADHLHAFIDDFRFTACLSLLKWFIEKTDNEGEYAVVSPIGTVPLQALEFSIRRCGDYIAAQSHEDIDNENERVWTHQWDQFISWYYKIIKAEAIFVSANTSVQRYINAAKHVVQRMRIKYWPQLDMDGIFNIWILKPGNKSRGRGIVLMNRIEDVVAKVNPANKSDTRFVIQKYIEKPLLIYNTKFDIRQWFIVTSAQPLTLWMYRESYLRFCSQDFRLNDLHESIHLSNHAVQSKYKNSPDRDPKLPPDNMWDATTFKNFLKSQGHGNVWDELIYPGMRQSLVGSLLASQETMDRRRNSFELYGADFMVMEDFSVWLIEINSHPDMSYSTSVTTKLCKQVMEDTIKVVIDFREDKTADTGLFELAYKQRLPSCQPYLGTSLSVQGRRILNDKKVSNVESKLISKLPMNYLPRKTSTTSSYIGPVIVDLIEDLEIQLDRELNIYCRYNSSNGSHSPLSSSPGTSSSRTSLTFVPVQVNDNSSLSTRPKPTFSRMPKTGRYSLRNNIAKGKMIDKKTTQKPVPSSANQPAISNSRERHRKEYKTAGESRKEQNNEKLLDIAMRNTIHKYKKMGVASIPLPEKSVNRTISSILNRKPKSTQKTLKKSEDSSDPANIYTLGLGMTK